MVGLHEHEYDVLVELQLPALITLCKENAQAIYGDDQNLHIITFPIYRSKRDFQHPKQAPKREILAGVRLRSGIVASEVGDDEYDAIRNLHKLLQDMVGKQSIREGFKLGGSRVVLG